MFIVNSYALAVALCVVTMICWGSWGNTQKLAAKSWRYELYYWDYVVGILLFSVFLCFTLGSFGQSGRSFLPDLMQLEGSKAATTQASRKAMPHCFSPAWHWSRLPSSATG